MTKILKNISTILVWLGFSPIEDEADKSVVDFRIKQLEIKAISKAIVALILSIAGICVLFLFFADDLKITQKAGQAGDLIGGVLNPLIAVIAAGLTFLAFYIQYRANELQKNSLAVERVEGRFFEMIGLHKENVNEMNIDGYKDSIAGRKVFVSMFEELKFLYCFLEDRYLENSTEDDFTPKEFWKEEMRLMESVYTIFFFGIDNTNWIDLKKSIGEEILKDLTIGTLVDDLNVLRTKHYDSSCNLDYPFTSGTRNLSVKHKLFRGHMSRLGHYYRHLYRSVKYIVEVKSETLRFRDRSELVGLLRSQLSNHEQLLLYYNYLAGYGEGWESGSHEYLSRYKMVHNLPINLADFDKKPLEHFKAKIKKLHKEDIQVFEWHNEISKEDFLSELDEIKIKISETNFENRISIFHLAHRLLRLMESINSINDEINISDRAEGDIRHTLGKEIRQLLRSTTAEEGKARLLISAKSQLVSDVNKILEE